MKAEDRQRTIDHGQPATNLTVVSSVLCFVSCVLCLFSIQSCKPDNNNFIADYSYDYAPIDSGHYVIYDVDSISYSNVRDTAKYQLMEIIGDTIYDNEGALCYELNLYRRANSFSSWAEDRKWKVKRTQLNFQKTEDDVTFVKLVFPPTQDADWNGNIYVPTTTIYKVFEDWDYHYSAVNAAFAINGFTFDSTITVSEVDNENLIEKTLRKEVYAKNVGLVYQEWEVLTKNVTDNWETGPRTGFRIRMKLAEHN